MIRSVQRALAVLECFDEASPILSLNEISKRVRLPKSTVFRLASTLVSSGFLLQKPNQEYTLSYKILTLASKIRRSFNVRDLYLPILEKVARECGETAEISMLSGKERICLDVVESSSPLKSVVTPGERLGLLRGATGKVFLAYMTEHEVAALLAETGRGDIPDQAALKRQLARIRSLGYAITTDERVKGATAISVPIRSEGGAVHHCLTVTGPSFRFAGRETELTELVTKASQEISTQLGFTALKS